MCNALQRTYKCSGHPLEDSSSGGVGAKLGREGLGLVGFDLSPELSPEVWERLGGS